MVTVEVVDDGGVGLVLEEGLRHEPLVEARGAVVGVAGDEGEVSGRVRVAVPPGVDQVGGGGKVLELGGAHQSARAWGGCWGGVVDGIDAVEVAAQEHCPVAVGGWQVGGEGGDEGEA